MLQGICVVFHLHCLGQFLNPYSGKKRNCYCRCPVRTTPKIQKASNINGFPVKELKSFLEGLDSLNG